MPLLFDFLDQSRQCNQASQKPKLPYHVPRGHHKITHHSVIIPNLPAPLHYLNFSILLGTPKAAIFSNIKLAKNELNTAMVLSSVSAHMVGQLHTYSIKDECVLNDEHYQFANQESLIGTFPHFKIQRQDDELAFDLNIYTNDAVTFITKLRWGFLDHWSMNCVCEGNIYYNNQSYQIQEQGFFEYARSIDFPYLPHAFYTYQLVNLKHNKQLIMAQTRDALNHILTSRLYLCDLDEGKTEQINEFVEFNISRLYPQVQTANGHKMYLPREFEWRCKTSQGVQIVLQAQSRGDFKFGLAAGFVGSFKYQLQIGDEVEIGESGYCEYIDVRLLKYQEIGEKRGIMQATQLSAPISLKK